MARSANRWAPGLAMVACLGLVACDDASAPTSGHHPIVLIFNHGTLRPQVQHSCNERRDVPMVVSAVAAQLKARIHYLCSKATDGKRAGSYTYKRAKEIRQVVDHYLDKGVPARRIFLVGHSAGGWSSLLAARQFGHKFNAVIAFAPAFAGPRHEVTRYPWWRRRIRPRQIADMEYAPNISGLVFAFTNDAYNRPRELRFLRQFRRVTLVPFAHCGARHGTTYSRCFADQVTDQIVRFIKARSHLQSASHE